MSLTTFNENELLRHIFEELDISKSDYERAVNSYNALGKYLKDSLGADVYPQGSFAFGTVTRPYSKGKDSEYDIDLVCEYELDANTTQKCKQVCGNTLKQDDTYAKLLIKEGRRCWTLEYAEQDKVGFHIDVLPCRKATYTRVNNLVSLGVDVNYAMHSIMITDKLSNGTYSPQWGDSNPRGYKMWLDEVTAPYRQLTHKAFDAASVEPVPEYYANKTIVHKIVQLLKRHRDVRFDIANDSDNKPISMIITTLVACIAKSNQVKDISAFELLDKVIISAKRIRDLTSHLTKDAKFEESFITKEQDGRWVISNPVDPEENFADKWHENNNAKAKAFFQWVNWLEQDLLIPLRSRDTVSAFKALQAGLGADIVKKIYLEKNLTATQSTINIQQKSELHSQPKPWRP